MQYPFKLGPPDSEIAKSTHIWDHHRIWDCSDSKIRYNVDLDEIFADLTVSNIGKFRKLQGVACVKLMDNAIVIE